MTLRPAFATASAVAACFAALWAGASRAQPDSNAADIVVTADRAEEIAQAYAEAVALAPTAADQYARWNFRLCPSVAGLAPADAQILIDHIARRAYAVGVEAERTGCQPNLVIIFAPDSDRLAQEIVATRRDLLGYYANDDVVTTGRDALADFANTPRPVRWWHVSRTTTADGQQLGDSRTRTGRSTRGAAMVAQSQNERSQMSSGNSMADLGVAASASGFEGAEGVRSQGSRLRRNTRQDLSFALMIVDTRRAAGLPPQAVADYLAMATLVQLDPGADMSAFPSILNLFAERADGRAPPVAMTEWDIAYLQGLYGATREASSARQQRSEIARRMAQRVTQD